MFPYQFDLCSCCSDHMGKRRSTGQASKGKQAQPVYPLNKRRRKSNLEKLQQLAGNYEMGNSVTVRQAIKGWEKEIHTEPEDNEAEADILDFITDPGNTRGRLTLFQQTVHTYWILKSLLAKAIQSMHPSQMEKNPKKAQFCLQDTLLHMEDQLQHIKITQYQATDRISRVDDRVGRIEKQLQLLHQVDMPGSTSKAPALVSSSEE